MCNILYIIYKYNYTAYSRRIYIYIPVVSLK